MAYDRSNLASFATANGQNLFQYRSTADALATIAADDYFLTSYREIGAGDFILVDGSDGSGFYRVLAASSTTVTVEPFPNQEFSGPVVVSCQIADISTASSAWAVSPVAGDVIKIYSVIDGAIATANAVLDPQIGGTSITGGGITVATAGSAAGDVDSATPTAARTVAAGGAIEVATNGASTNTVKCNVYFVIQPT